MLLLRTFYKNCPVGIYAQDRGRRLAVEWYVMYVPENGGLTDHRETTVVAKQDLDELTDQEFRKACAWIDSNVPEQPKPRRA